MSQELFRRDMEEKISEWLSKVRFRKQIFGGVSQADVFKKISELNDMYREALIAERARYDALIAEKLSGQGTPSEQAKRSSAEEGDSE
ncbi:MAG: hypothetical protein IK140_03320 [Clostridia bacterium]|nr:hypothetical protein [Clostridia bacterium]MBR5379541.1 hypothetical protein [Clostridia bacterium]